MERESKANRLFCHLKQEIAIHNHASVILFDAPCAPAFDWGRLQFSSSSASICIELTLLLPYNNHMLQSYWDGICQSAMLVMFEHLSSVVVYV